MKAFKLSVLSMALLSIAACKKDKVVTQPTPIKLSGVYIGQFTYSYYGATIYGEGLQGNVTVTFSGSKYKSTSPSDNFAAGADGSFVVNNDKQITFADSSVHPANFNWGIILNGSYNYSTKGDSLFLINKSSSTISNYRLKKQ
ncbi:hypothetical protein [Mucilaginibacter agri]|uniref:Lipocalin-like domain-containing protein n=1 Tax=Mucilaginibacter agri TaxID=2695265 RepID=A0A965ZM07_9SPHI|nr:hypothetical protein [Mucilaginibacter agri]NCD72166.1 hypothetical protein [Mucilaginibacter agri]